jgi:hypothetical protein
MLRESKTLLELLNELLFTRLGSKAEADDIHSDKVFRLECSSTSLLIIFNLNGV